MKKICLTLVLITFFSISFGQNKTNGQLPQLISNTNSQDSAASLILNEYAKMYDFVFAFSETGTWKNYQDNYKIVGLIGDECYAIQYTKSRKRNAVPTIETTEIDKKSFLTFLTALTKLNFWELNKDSLNQICVKNDCLVAGDGTGYKFEVVSKDAFQKLQSYMPELYLEHFPSMVQRKTFIDCRDLFKKFWREAIGFIATNHRLLARPV